MRLLYHNCRGKATEIAKPHAIHTRRATARQYSCVENHSMQAHMKRLRLPAIIKMSHCAAVKPKPLRLTAAKEKQSPALHRERDFAIALKAIYFNDLK